MDIDEYFCKTQNLSNLFRLIIKLFYYQTKLWILLMVFIFILDKIDDDIVYVLWAFIKDIGDIHEYLISMSNSSIYRYIDISTDIFILALNDHTKGVFGSQLLGWVRKKYQFNVWPTVVVKLV